MRLFFLGPRFGPRFFRFRPGISFGPEDFRRSSRPSVSTQAIIDPVFVYVVRGDHSRCKIGITNNPNRRMLELSNASAFPLSFAYIGATQSGHGGGVEREAHAMLDRFRTNGEWFNCPEELAIAAVNAATVKVGDKIVSIDPSRIDELMMRAGAISAPKPVTHIWQLFIMVPPALIISYFYAHFIWGWWQ